MIILGLVLLIAGFFLKIAIRWSIGIALLCSPASPRLSSGRQGEPWAPAGSHRR
jgi:hypothetical protein